MSVLISGERGNVEATVIRDVANGKPSDPKNPSSHEDLLDPKGTISITSNHIITKSDVFGLPPAWAEVCPDNHLVLNIVC